MADALLNYEEQLKPVLVESNKQVFKTDYCKQYLLDNITLTDTTLKGYKICLNAFIKWLADTGISNPTEQDLKEYVSYLKYSNYTTGTKNQYIRAVKHLFIWLAKNNLYPNIAEDLKGFKDNTKVKKDAFNEADIKKILADIDTTTITGKRDKALMLLIITGGLRLTEVFNIDLQDIEQKNNNYIVNIKGKGHQEKDNYIKIIKPVYDAIKDYLDTRDIKSNKEPLFISASNRKTDRLTKESMSQILKGRFRASGFDSRKLTAHSLRHSTATIYLKSGADLYKAQRHLRHTDPKTTEIYINLNDKEQATAEQDIYNQIFNQDKQIMLNEIKQEINNLNAKQLTEILNKIREVKTNE